MLGLHSSTVAKTHLGASYQCTSNPYISGTGLFFLPLSKPVPSPGNRFLHHYRHFTVGFRKWNNNHTRSSLSRYSISVTLIWCWFYTAPSSAGEGKIPGDRKKVWNIERNKEKKKEKKVYRCRFRRPHWSVVFSI